MLVTIYRRVSFDSAPCFIISDVHGFVSVELNYLNDLFKNINLTCTLSFHFELNLYKKIKSENNNQINKKNVGCFTKEIKIFLNQLE